MNLFNFFRRKRKKSEETFDLNELHVLRGSNYPCDKCSIENKYCFKLTFSNRTICVAPKDKVNTFSLKHRKVQKPAAKI